MKSLILATDMTRQQEFYSRLKVSGLRLMTLLASGLSNYGDVSRHSARCCLTQPVSQYE